MINRSIKNLKGKRIVVDRFKNTAEYINYLVDEYVKNISQYDLYNDPEHIKFAGGDLNMALESALTGNAVEIQKYKDKLTEVLNKNSLDVSMRMDVEGVAYDMGAVLSGEPECCIQQEFVVPKRELNILYTFACPWYFTVDQLYNMGVAALTLQSKLKELNYVVNLKHVEFYNSSVSSKEQMCLSIDINNEFNPTSLMAATSHPTFFRTLGFMHKRIYIPQDSGGNGNASWPNSDFGGVVPFTEILDLDPYKTFQIPSAYDNSAWREESKTPESAVKFLAKLFNEWAANEVINDEAV